jgi:hypothetical protein
VKQASRNLSQTKSSAFPTPCEADRLFFRTLATLLVVSALVMLVNVALSLGQAIMSAKPSNSSRGREVPLFSEEVEVGQNESSNRRMNATAFLILGSVFGFMTNCRFGCTAKCAPSCAR